MVLPPTIKRLATHGLLGSLSLGELPVGVSLEVKCWSQSCGRTVYLGADELLRRHGPTRTVDQLTRRLRCACGCDWPSISAVVCGWREGMPVPKLPSV
jgi:hypothetical protein